MKKILVAEDEKVMRYMIKDFLENYDFEVIQAENGLDAYVLWKNEKPDILLTDINMPKMNGIELLQRIKNTTPDFPVIVMTGVNIETSVNIANNN
ncbi:MAG TPA: response regulator, partial [Candidatus Cloacimonadota bacterium]|nr:response regulator [Candidatus Cloacimonadota bacterium]